MSSHPSVDPAATCGDVRNALALVAESSFFTFAEPIDQARFAEWVDETGAVPWVRVAVTFTGTFDGGLDIDLPELLGARLLSSFAGLSPDEQTPDADVRDMIGEFANMVCGSWLTQSRRGDRFDLTPPSVQYLKAGPPPQPSRDVAGTVLVAIDGVPLRVTLVMTNREKDRAVA
jgi:hypothetical protein